jgi:hypothetical protein
MCIYTIYIYIYIHTGSTQTCVYDFTHRGRFLCQPCKHQRYEVQTEDKVWHSIGRTKSHGNCFPCQAYAITLWIAIRRCPVVLQINGWARAKPTRLLWWIWARWLSMWPSLSGWIVGWTPCDRVAGWISMARWMFSPLNGAYFPKGCEGSNLPTDGPTYQILSA